MSNPNLLADFSDYIRSLSVAHVDIKHSEAKKHFIELNSDEQLALKYLSFPVVALEKLTISYTGMEDALSKNRYVEIMFLDYVKDPTNYDQVQQVKQSMERVAEDYIKKMKLDRRNRIQYPFLRNLSVSNMELNFVENKSINLFGALLSFNFELPFVETLETGRFV